MDNWIHLEGDLNKKANRLDDGISTGRRHLMVSAGLALAFPGLAGARVVATTASSGRENLELWYERPAGAWVEALPVGNGRLGAMCFGRVAQERIQLNEDTLFAGGPYDPNNPRSLEALPAIRALVDQGKFREAADMIASSMIAKPAGQMPYGAAGDLLLDFLGISGAGNYQRTLELDTAIATTRFTDGQARVRARGGVELDLDWAEGRMKRLRLRGKPHDKVQVRYRDRLIHIVLDKKGAGAVM